MNGSRRLRLTEDQRRRLAVKGQVLGRRRLAAVAGIVTHDTILRWYRRPVGAKYDSSQTRRPGRPTTKLDIARNTIKAILKDHGIEPVVSRAQHESGTEIVHAARA